MSGTVISYPIPAYSNVSIEADFYQPSRFVISAITLGQLTTITTSVAHNYVIGQLVRLLIPNAYGSYQLNETQSYVVAIPSTTQVTLKLDSVNVSTFIATPYTAVITNATQAANAVLTANNTFGPGQLLTIQNVQGMTQLNGFNRIIVSRTATTITLNLNSSGFSAYTSGGVAILQTPNISQPQILAIGDINQGIQNSTGRRNTGTFIPGSFINISP